MTIYELIVQLLKGAGITLIVCVSAFCIGGVLGLPLAVARRSKHIVPQTLASIFVEVVRGIPPIVWLFVLYYGLANDLLRINNLTAAIISFSGIAAAYLCEIYRAGLESIARGQWEAGRALGLSGFRLYRLIVAPQAILVVIPPMTTYAIGLLKDSAVISVIGVQDITFWAVNENQTNPQGLLIFGIAAVLYIALSIPLGVSSRKLDRTLSQWRAAQQVS